MGDSKPTIVTTKAGLRPDLVYSALLLVSAVAALAVAASTTDQGFLTGEYDWRTAGFFFLFGLFTITTGFPHPVFGHVSFDRVAQVASILVLGPIDAAWVNGLASFIYPWQRLRQGVSLRSVVMASLHNSGLMILVVLGAGLLYQTLGGAIPLGALSVSAAMLVIVLVVGMQITNDLGMMFMLYLRRGDPYEVFNRFTAAVEYVSGGAGVVLAIAFTTQSTSYFALQVLVFAAGMIVIMQYALMRYRLEGIVAERTEELRVQAERFERQATHDKLTGLPNRRHADDYLKQQFDLAQRNNHVGALAFADIDHFKQINDGYSHAIGDKVLERVARILSEGCRKTDFVARHGGEEFLLYFPNTGTEPAERVCSQLRMAVENADWASVSPGLRVTLSFGLAEFVDPARSETVLGKADERLYQAKREGRNRVIAA